MELLSPAGSPEALTAAVQNGANAVYLGCGDFNARRRAKTSLWKIWLRRWPIVMSGASRSTSPSTPS